MGPTAQKRLGQDMNVPALTLSKPASPFNSTEGKKAARATPMFAFAAAMLRSAAEISGLRSSNSEGNPGGITGGRAGQRTDRNPKRSGCLSHQKREGVLVARAVQRHSRQLGLGVFKHGFRLGNFQFVGHSAGKAIGCQVV